MRRRSFALAPLLLACARLPASHAAPARSLAAAAVTWLSPSRAMRVGTSPAGDALVVWGGVRMSVHDGVARLAPEQIDDAIEFAAPVNLGWAFVTRHGAVLTAATFLGALTPQRPPEGALATPVGVLPGQRGRLALSAHHGAAFATDGGPLTALRLGASRRITTVGFRSAAQGVAIADDGALWHTRDGGASWQIVPDGAGTLALALRTDTLVSSDSGTRALADDGSLVPFRADAEAPAERDDPGVWRDALAALGPPWRDALRWVSFPDGVEASVSRGTVRVVHRETGRALATFVVPDDCGAHAAGPLLQFGCPAHDLEDSTYSTWRDPRAGGAVLATVPPALSSALPSERPSLSVALGACDDPYPSALPLTEPPTAPALCVITDPRREGRTQPLPAPVLALRGVYGGFAVVQPDAHSLARVSVDGTTTNLTPLWRAPGHRVTAAVGPHGVITAIAQGAGGVRVWVSSPDGGGAEVPTPAGCTRAVFADAAHGFAWRRDLRAVFRTLDRGQHWEPLPPLCIDVDPQAPPNEDPWTPDAAQCSLSRCLLDARVTVVGWGPLAAPPACVRVRPGE